MPIIVKRVASPDDRAKIYALRHAVFVGEQRVPEEVERDEYDATADHVIAVTEQNFCVGTGRLVEEEGHGRVGRMAVHPMWRNRGVGRSILVTLEGYARQKGLGKIVLHAQVDAEPFYAKQGYERAGPVFVEAGIDHVKMEKRL